jgi:hypothetical protein
MTGKLPVLAVLIVVFVVALSAAFAWSDGAYSSSPPQGFIDTVAGGGAGCTEPCPATSAALPPPYDVERDWWGNLYVADYQGNRVRKVDNAGILTIVAGDGNAGIGGDGGLATSAQVATPHAVAVDHLGNLYIAEYGWHRVRKVNTNGVISTVAGGGGCERPCLATSAAVSYPSGMTVDASGNLFIAEQGGAGLVSKVDLSGIISTVAGGGPGCTEPCPATQASLSTPTDLSLDSSGNLYIAEHTGNVRKVDTLGIITTVVAVGADAVDVDPWDNLYVATGCRILRRAPGGNVSVVAGSDSECGFSGDRGPATDALMGSAYGVAAGRTSGGFYIADGGNARIREVGGTAPVGGMAEAPQHEPQAVSSDGGSSAPSALAPVGIAAASTLLAAGAWYARKRRRAGPPGTCDR